MKILVTGCAGFIGYHLTKKLLNKNIFVVGVDNLNNYYDVNLKKKRLDKLNIIKKKKFHFYKTDICNKKQIEIIFKKYKFQIVINLAAQAGVRYSIINPAAYTKSNLLGFFNILENCRKFKVQHFLYASTSSVYGSSKKKFFNERDYTEKPIQFYAATKKSNELMACSYSYLYKLHTIGLRFFTVYGPWGRPDMALFKFTKNILSKKRINIFNYGKHERDFTYIDDVVDSIFLLLKKFKINKNSNFYEIYNIGKGQSNRLDDYILEIENNLKLRAKKNYLSLQKGDVIRTSADTSKLKKVIKKNKFVSIKIGVKKFIDWYLDYYKIKI